LVLVVCEEADLAAFWAAERLQSRGLPVEIVTGADLAAAERWEHRLGRSGITLALTFAGGQRCLHSRDVGGVLNRLSFVPSAWLQRIDGPDVEYAIQEMHAFYLSWLHALPGPILNRPTPQGLCGNWRHPSAWAFLAAHAGLPIAPYRQSSEDDPAKTWRPAREPPRATVLVIGERVLAPSVVPENLHDACRRLARDAGTTLLGINFEPAAGAGWEFSGASVMPDLVRGGEPVADALAEAFA
jgi:hypothetical protein